MVNRERARYVAKRGGQGLAGVGLVAAAAIGIFFLVRANKKETAPAAPAPVASQPEKECVHDPTLCVHDPSLCEVVDSCQTIQDLIDTECSGTENSKSCMALSNALSACKNQPSGSTGAGYSSMHAALVAMQQDLDTEKNKTCPVCPDEKDCPASIVKENGDNVTQSEWDERLTTCAKYTSNDKDKTLNELVSQIDWNNRISQSEYDKLAKKNKNNKNIIIGLSVGLGVLGLVTLLLLFFCRSKTPVPVMSVPSAIEDSGTAVLPTSVKRVAT